MPTAVLTDLRAEFGAEIGQRIGSFEPGADPDAARRDAHVLASSAWVVGEPDIARLARAVEHDLSGGPVDELLAQLRRYVA